MNKNNPLKILNDFNEDETNSQLLKTIKDNKDLSDIGLQVETKDIDFTIARSLLCTRRKEFYLCLEWLKLCQLTKGLNKNHTSYFYAVKVAEWASIPTISNGALIAAALHSKLKYERIIYSNNIYLPISKTNFR